jgi:hypothetical protein
MRMEKYLEKSYSGQKQSFPRVKQPGHGNDHPFPSSTEVMNEYRYTATLPLCRHGMLQGNLYFSNRKTYASATLSITNPTLTHLGLNLGLHGERLATDSLSHCIAITENKRIRLALLSTVTRHVWYITSASIMNKARTHQQTLASLLLCILPMKWLQSGIKTEGGSNKQYWKACSCH